MLEKEDLEVRAVLKIEQNTEIYKIVDFLNKNLKEMGLIFGLSKEEDKIKITIYNS